MQPVSFLQRHPLSIVLHLPQADSICMMCSFIDVNLFGNTVYSVYKEVSALLGKDCVVATLNAEYETGG